jgi:hypothetical protein
MHCAKLDRQPDRGGESGAARHRHGLPRLFPGGRPTDRAEHSARHAVAHAVRRKSRVHGMSGGLHVAFVPAAVLQVSHKGRESQDKDAQSGRCSHGPTRPAGQKIRVLRCNDRHAADGRSGPNRQIVTQEHACLASGVPPRTKEDGCGVTAVWCHAAATVALLLLGVVQLRAGAVFDRPLVHRSVSDGFQQQIEGRYRFATDHPIDVACNHDEESFASGDGVWLLPRRSHPPASRHAARYKFRADPITRTRLIRYRFCGRPLPCSFRSHGAAVSAPAQAARLSNEPSLSGTFATSVARVSFLLILVL